MSQLFINPIMNEGLEKGEEKAARKIAANMLSKGIPVESVVELTGLTLEQVQQIQAQQSENLS